MRKKNLIRIIVFILTIIGIIIGCYFYLNTKDMPKIKIINNSDFIQCLYDKI